MGKLLKLLVADDEWHIREGIRYSLNWDKYNIEVVGEAEDGEIAVELALQHEIDILLVDLNMPILDGISVVKQLKEKLPNCRVVIITGFDDFGFARDALRLGVDDYLLKPVLPETLDKIIQKISDELQMKSDEVIFNKIISKYANENFNDLLNRFCIDWAVGQLNINEVKEFLQFFNRPIDYPKIFINVKSQELKKNQTMIKSKDKKLLISAMKNIISEILIDYQFIIFNSDSEQLNIISWDIIDEEHILECENNIEKYLKLTTRIKSKELSKTFTSITTVYNNFNSNSTNEETGVTPIVQRAKKYMKEHFSNKEFTLEYLANYLQVSPVYLSRIFKQELGTTFVSYLTKLRIKKAINLLNTTSLKINEIAEQVGYDSQHYFSTAFKKVVGVSPNQYRRGM